MEGGCFYCGTNAWTDCKHRKGVPKPERLKNPPVDARSMYKPKPGEGNGRNFQKRAGNYKKKWGET